ncbi:hypothetical protein V511_05630 [Mesotoga sp. Brook.08.YT.4.2.5.1]|uniref:hypothetical protein n=1 Tax=unclassified Mesotoga TaxID=1184398 RepID=UPI000CB9A10B|nr:MULTISPECIES: hypothetical protein [unclassified Mesotoga]PNE22846.1 hypothetical protein V511_05630 [Mesotoga sp. Brook.08.YT.4.2.5.1]RAO96128.1 hypothetical protein M388_03450 [Mesotoga sp. Brook.08.YT.4.2.5.4.]RDI90746.1 hypothetical protein Q502_13095 [Mesotoga sp. Brook.08.YT.4.2.5.2.]
MKITFLPHSRLGNWDFFLSLAFVVLLFAQIQFSLIPLPVFSVMALGVEGFVLSMIAFLKRDRAVGKLLSIIIGAAIIFVFGSILIMSTDLFNGFLVAKDYLQKSEREKLNNINIWQFDGVAGNWMYVTDYVGPRYRVKLDGSVGTRMN